MTQRKPEREPEGARESQREPERAGQRARESQSEPEKARENLCGSLWLSLWFSLWLYLAPSGSLWLSQALFCSPNLLTKPLLGSQGPCSARNAVPEFPHFNQPRAGDTQMGIRKTPGGIWMFSFTTKVMLMLMQSVSSSPMLQISWANLTMK